MYTPETPEADLLYALRMARGALADANARIRELEGERDSLVTGFKTGDRMVAELRARVKELEGERDDAIGKYEVRDADADCLSVKLDNALNETSRLKALLREGIERTEGLPDSELMGWRDNADTALQGQE